MSESQTVPANILIVDDALSSLQLLVKLLSKQGYVIRPAARGLTALMAAQREPPDLILLDIKLPDIDGYELCQQLKADPRTSQAPVIFISGLDQPLDKVKAFEVGGVDYLTKPVQIEELLVRVQTHLTISRLRRRLEQYNQQLETEVQSRTAELRQANLALQTEIELRQQRQQEKDRLLEMAHHQSEQLRNLTKWLLETQQHKQQNLAQTINDQLVQRLTLLEHNLELIQFMVVDTHLVSPTTAGLVARQTQDSLELLRRTSAELQTVAADLSQPPPLQPQTNLQLQLSAREKEVLLLLAGGKSVADIAALLYLSPATVYTHRSHLMEKLDAANLPDLLRIAAQHGLIVPA